MCLLENNLIVAWNVFIWMNTTPALFMDPGIYIEKMERAYSLMFNETLVTKYQLPLEEGDHSQSLTPLNS